MSRRRLAIAGMIGACLLSACAAPPAPKPAPPATPPAAPTPGAPPAASSAPVAEAAPAAAERGPTGLSIYEAFRDGLAEPRCDNAQPRWHRHFLNAPQRLGDPDDDALVLFGYVVQSLREAGLPTEFALIPFVESGYAPGARSRSGPAGLWQFVPATARHHGVRIGAGYDGRLAPAEATRAAVRYLDHLYRRFDRNWRLALMAYNAGEFRVHGALRRSGTAAGAADPPQLPGLATVTYAYVEKLHALACLLEQAGERPQWRARLDRPVVPLREQPLAGRGSLAAWAAVEGHDLPRLRRLNPALEGAWPAGEVLALVPASPAATAADAEALRLATVATMATVATADTYVVRRGDSAWSIARRHGVSIARLLELNGLRADSVLQPGMVLKLL